MEKTVKKTNDSVLNVNSLINIKKLIAVLVACIVIIIVAFKFIKVQDIVLKQIYPKKYNEYVEKYASQFNVDELLVYAIIKAESNFKYDIVSSSNAIGLMQLLDATAKETAENLGIEYKTQDLYDPEINIMLGIKYYSELLYEYDNNYLLALTAYNAGTGNVQKWIENDIIKPDGSDLENIPYKETNNYVRKIVRDYEIYKKLY